MAAHRSKAITAALLHKESQMKRFWLVPLAALSLAGAVSVAQAAPASPLLGTLAATSQSAGNQQVNWRRHHYRRHHQHRRHHQRHHRRHHRHHG
jgi:ABC-type Zn2+ transport system substrate-binding protein/surface adhesin